MYKATSEFEKRRAEGRSKTTDRADVLREVTAVAGALSRTRLVQQLETERSKSAKLTADVARMRQTFARTGQKNPNYSRALSELAEIKGRIGELNIKIQEAKAETLEQRERALKTALETRNDVFVRFAKLMLADDVFGKIARTANEEWRRLYDVPS